MKTTTPVMLSGNSKFSEFNLGVTFSPAIEFPLESYRNVLRIDRGCRLIFLMRAIDEDVLIGIDPDRDKRGRPLRITKNFGSLKLR
jgi:hypothetical protein